MADGFQDGSSELNNTEASFISDGGVSVDQRKMNAVRAYFEWMPIRSVPLQCGSIPTDSDVVKLRWTTICASGEASLLDRCWI